MWTAAMMQITAPMKATIPAAKIITMNFRVAAVSIDYQKNLIKKHSDSRRK